jgi:hypothetical protein
MEITFNEFVEHIRELSLKEKEEIKFILEKELIAARKDEILNNYQESRKEEAEGRLEYSNDINILKKILYSI